MSDSTQHRKFELIFEGPIDDSIKTLQRLKGIFISDFELSVPEVQHILEHAPQRVYASDTEEVITSKLATLKKAGAKVYLLKKQETTQSSDTHEEELIFDLDDISFADEEPERPQKIYSLDVDDVVFNTLDTVEEEEPSALGAEHTVHPPDIGTTPSLEMEEMPPTPSQEEIAEKPVVAPPPVNFAFALEEGTHEPLTTEPVKTEAPAPLQPTQTPLSFELELREPTVAKPYVPLFTSVVEETVQEVNFKSTTPTPPPPVIAPLSPSFDPLPQIDLVFEDEESPQQHGAPPSSLATAGAPSKPSPPPIDAALSFEESAEEVATKKALESAGSTRHQEELATPPKIEAHTSRQTPSLQRNQEIAPLSDNEDIQPPAPKKALVKQAALFIVCAIALTGLNIWYFGLEAFTALIDDETSPNLEITALTQEPIQQDAEPVKPQPRAAKVIERYFGERLDASRVISIKSGISRVADSLRIEDLTISIQLPPPRELSAEEVVRGALKDPWFTKIDAEFIQPDSSSLEVGTTITTTARLTIDDNSIKKKASAPARIVFTPSGQTIKATYYIGTDSEAATEKLPAERTDEGYDFLVTGSIVLMRTATTP
jgi:hypothetical protein